MLIVAHRGFSGRQPEMTRAAYLEAVGWAEQTGVELGLECDVHFSADDELICLHDLTVDRTSDGHGPAYGFSVAELRRLNFARGLLRRPSPDQRALVTLEELLELIRAARRRGVGVHVVIETKHPNPRGADVEARVADLLGAYGWDRSGSPVRVISFDVAAVHRLALLLPDLERTLLVEQTLEPWSDGRLPAFVRTVGPDLALLRRDPGFVARTDDNGNEVHVWTANTRADIDFCLDLGVTGITTDHPDRVAAALVRQGRRGPQSGRQGRQGRRTDPLPWAL